MSFALTFALIRAIRGKKTRTARAHRCDRRACLWAFGLVTRRVSEENTPTARLFCPRMTRMSANQQSQKADVSAIRPHHLFRPNIRADSRHSREKNAQLARIAATAFLKDATT
jgi:hypothetical protein